jgi:predicted regulator of Ras-like GTPase activity (Roadblock/LC7/MglB family)/predicted negative regulator of RcsB-dependent stress response
MGTEDRRMGWISNLLANREIGRLEELARTAPAPSVYLRLRQLYEEMGEAERAEQIARQGVQRFPDSKELQQATAQADQARHFAQKERLRARLEQYPNPTLYAKLAHLHLADDEIDECVRLCRSSLKSYPQYGGTHLILAEVALKQEDHETAFEHLRKAIDLDKFNYQALMLLAREHLRRGEREEGRQCLETILHSAPGDEKAEAMLRDFDRLADELAEEARSETPTKKLSRAAATTTQLAAIREAEPAPAAAAAPAAAPADAYAEPIRDLMNVRGVSGCLVIDKFGLIIASEFAAERDEELAAALVTNIFRASESAVEPLNFGSFEEGILESDDGSLHVMNLQETVVAVFSGAEARPGLLQRAVHTFAEKVAAIS